jgi:hypothetical protein
MEHVDLMEYEKFEILMHLQGIRPAFRGLQPKVEAKRNIELKLQKHYHYILQTLNYQLKAQQHGDVDDG